MKKNLTFLAFTCLFLSCSYAATLTVNNANPTVGQFSTVQAAVDAAASGDTILIQGSATDYDQITLPNTKALTLRGAGWSPTKPYRTHIPYISFDPLAHDITIEGIFFIGTAMRDSVINGVRYGGQSNITFQYCTGGINLTKFCSNFLIQNCFTVVAGHPRTSNITIRYCVLNYLQNFNGYEDNGGRTFHYTNNLLIDHNILQGSSLYEIKRATITNNIFYEFDVSRAEVTECLITNNLTYYPSQPSKASFFTGNSQTKGNFLGNNLINVDPLLINPDLSQTLRYANLQLQPSSPCKNAASDGTDIGIYTPTMSFSKTGEVTPSVRVFQIANPSTTANGTLNVVKMTASKARDGN
jgi:hypothetical protein